MRSVPDTNVLIDYLCGVEAAHREIELYEEPCISIVTWIEVLVGARDSDDEARLRGFLGRFRVLPIDQDVAERAVRIRRRHRVRVPDAVVWATAQSARCLLVTRDVRDFPRDDPGIRVPYRL